VRQRILLSTLAVLTAALLAFAVPLGFAVRSVLSARALDMLQGELEQLRLVIDQQARTCGEVEFILGLGQQRDLDLSVFSPSGRWVLAEPGHRPEAGPAVASAAQGAVGRAILDERIVTALPLTSRACGGPMILQGQRPADALTDSVQRAWLAIAAVGASVLAIAALAASAQGRRLAAPLEALARSARDLGDGDFTSRAPRSGLPEADAIADALDATADRLGRAVQRGSAFAADASHQLRTPLTALRLNLESLEPRDPDAVAAALAEADRLEATVDELVTLTRLDATESDVDLAELVTERVEAWRELAAAEGRRVRVEVLPVPAVRARAAAVGQALQVLLDNALEHGRGDVSIRVSPSLPDGEFAGHGARVCVSDEGGGIPAEVVTARVGADRGGAPLPVRGGRGLVLARSLVEAEGGRLTLEATGTGTRACLVLPG
jgi:signal transduction histidine kinase